MKKMLGNFIKISAIFTILFAGITVFGAQNSNEKNVNLKIYAGGGMSIVNVYTAANSDIAEMRPGYVVVKINKDSANRMEGGIQFYVLTKAQDNIKTLYRFYIDGNGNFYVKAVNEKNKTFTSNTKAACDFDYPTVSLNPDKIIININNQPVN
jgi:hypothetical protein